MLKVINALIRSIYLIQSRDALSNPHFLHHPSMLFVSNGFIPQTCRQASEDGVVMYQQRKVTEKKSAKSQNRKVVLLLQESYKLQGERKTQRRMGERERERITRLRDQARKGFCFVLFLSVGLCIRQPSSRQKTQFKIM